VAFNLTLSLKMCCIVENTLAEKADYICSLRLLDFAAWAFLL
jgi:hypothetical protein